MFMEGDGDVVGAGASGAEGGAWVIATNVDGDCAVDDAFAH